MHLCKLATVQFGTRHGDLHQPDDGNRTEEMVARMGSVSIEDIDSMPWSPVVHDLQSL